MNQLVKNPRKARRRERVRVFDRLNRTSLPFMTAKPGDVGHDLFSVILPMNMSLLERIIWRTLLFFKRSVVPFRILWPGQIKLVNTGLHLDMPDNLWCEVRSRSSASKKKLVVIGGTIDSGYNGELFTVLHNVGWTPRIIMENERYSQVIFHWAYRPEMRPINEEEFLEVVSNSHRAMTGFGSTGQ